MFSPVVGRRRLAGQRRFDDDEVVTSTLGFIKTVSRYEETLGVHLLQTMELDSTIYSKLGLRISLWDPWGSSTFGHGGLDECLVEASSIVAKTLHGACTMQNGSSPIFLLNKTRPEMLQGGLCILILKQRRLETVCSRDGSVC